MGFLDSINSIKDRLTGGGNDEYYEDEYYDEGYDDGLDAAPAPAPRPRETGSHTTLLGNTPRPEADSVSVYTRSGRPVASQTSQIPRQPAPAARSYAAPSPVTPAYTPSYDTALGGSGAPTPGDLGPKTFSRVTSGQLPPYVLKPVSYDDVQTVVRRVRTNQPVVLVLSNTNIETAKRILDFSFGLSFGLEGEVRELGDRVFVVLPHGIELTPADINKLVADGDLSR